MKLFETLHQHFIANKNLKKTPPFLGCSMVIPIIILLQFFCQVTASTNISDAGTFQSTLSGCPDDLYGGIKLLHHRSVRSIPKIEDRAFKVGDNLTLTCDHEGYGLDENQPLFVYPTPTRTCRQDGTWSCAPPICANPNEVPTEDINVVPMRAVLCTKSTISNVCSDAKKKWVLAGSVVEDCSHNVKDSIENVTRLEVLFTFARHVHLSFITFEPYDNASDFKIEVKVAPLDVIREFSQEALDFTTSHYNTFRRVSRSTRSPVDQCAVTQIGVYAKEIFIRFSIEKIEKSSATYDSDSYLNFLWRPRPKFYQVPNIDSRRKMAWYGAECPKRPTIKHAFVIHESKDSVAYACKGRNKLVDPITNETSDGKLRCVNRFEWAPYPVPVCRPCLEEDADCQTPVDGADTSPQSSDAHDPPKIGDVADFLDETESDTSYQRGPAYNSQKPLPDSSNYLFNEGPYGLKDSMYVITQLQHETGVSLNWIVVSTGFFAILLGFVTGLLLCFLCHKKCAVALRADEESTPKRSPIVRNCYYASAGTLHKDKSKSATYPILSDESLIYIEKPWNMKKTKIPYVHQQCKRWTYELSGNK